MSRKEVYKEMEETFGLVPGFFKLVPDSSLRLEWDLFNRSITTSSGTRWSRPATTSGRTWGRRRRDPEPSPRNGPEGLHPPGLFLRIHRKNDAVPAPRGFPRGRILYSPASRAGRDPPQVNPEPAVQA